MPSMPVEALVPFFVVIIGFTVICVVSVLRSEGTRNLNRALWCLICLISMPLGGVLYLLLGRKK